MCGCGWAQLWQPYAAYITLVCLTGRERKELEEEWEIQWEREEKEQTASESAESKRYKAFFVLLIQHSSFLTTSLSPLWGFAFFYLGGVGGGMCHGSRRGTHTHTHTGGFTLLAIAQRFDASLSPVRRHAVLLPQGTLIYRHANLGQNVSSWKGQICIEKERSRGRQDRRG